MLNDFGAYYKEFPNETQITDDFKLWLTTKRHPEWKEDKVRTARHIVTTVLSRPRPEGAAFIESLNHLRGTKFFRDLADSVGQGQTSVDQAINQVASYQSPSCQESLVVYDLQAIQQGERTSGFYWRLEDLNRSLGPLHKGDLIIVGKRPEVGGTSFLVSEMAHMLEQTDGNAVIFNNEEEPTKVFSRMVSAALGCTYRTLMGDPQKYDQEYKDWLGESEWDLVHDTQMTIGSITKTLKDKEYELIGINVLLKVGGTGEKEDHDKLQALGTWLRRISQEHGPVIAIVQADPSAEGVPYIPQDRIYKSKTALQGEADGLIMIGTDEQIQDDVRYIHVAKNKIPPAPCTDPHCKHIKSQVDFDPQTGRFTSANLTGNSRSMKP